MGTPSAELTTVRLKTPIDDTQLEQLRIGNVVYIDSVIMTGREGVYQRLLADSMEPCDWRNRQHQFHCSPHRSTRAASMGAVTATASFRLRNGCRNGLR